MVDPITMLREGRGGKGREGKGREGRAEKAKLQGEGVKRKRDARKKLTFLGNFCQ